MKKIVFVYNAESGLFNGLADAAHKAFSPETYECNLCALTYGSLTMKKDWKDFVAQAPVEIVFMHRNEFYEAYDRDDKAFPAGYLVSDEGVHVLITTDEINNQKSLETLKQLVTDKIRNL